MSPYGWVISGVGAPSHAGLWPPTCPNYAILSGRPSMPGTCALQNDNPTLPLQVPCKQVPSSSCNVLELYQPAICLKTHMFRMLPSWYCTQWPADTLTEKFRPSNFSWKGRKALFWRSQGDPGDHPSNVRSYKHHPLSSSPQGRTCLKGNVNLRTAVPKSIPNALQCKANFQKNHIIYIYIYNIYNDRKICLYNIEPHEAVPEVSRSKVHITQNKHVPIEWFVTTASQSRIWLKLLSDDSNKVGICLLCRSTQLHAARNCMRQQVAGRSSQRHATLPTYWQSSTPYWKSTTLHYKVLLQYYSVLQSTTLYYKVLLQYYSVLHSTTPVLLCTTQCYSSTTLYYKVLLQYYSVLQSTTPVLLRTTQYYSSTTPYYTVLLQYYSVLHSATPALLRTKYYSSTTLYYKVLLCTTKYYSSTTLYYKVLLQYYSVLQSTTPVLLCTTKYYSSTTLYYKVLIQYYSSTTLYYKVLLQYYPVLQSTTPQY